MQLIMDRPSLPLAEAFRTLCAHIGDIHPYNPDEDDEAGGWLELGFTLPQRIKAAAERPGMDFLEYSGTEVSVIHLVHALVTFSYDRSAVAYDLYQHLVGDQSARVVVEKLIAIGSTKANGAEEEEEEEDIGWLKCGKGGSSDRIGARVRPTSWLKPADGLTWARAAERLVESSEVRRCLRSWARVWFDDLLIPFMTKAGERSTANLPAGTVAQMRAQLLQRDGPVTVAGGIIDRDFLTSQNHAAPTQNYRAAGILAPAHIIPSAASSNPRLRSLLETFSGGWLTPATVLPDAINAPSNSLLLPRDQHDDFANFVFSIEAIPPHTAAAAATYQLRLYTTLVCPSLGICADGEEITFSTADASVSSPDPRLCNLHTAVAKVVRASGADRAIFAIRSDERRLKDAHAGFTGANWGCTGGWEYLARELHYLQDTTEVDEV